MTNSFSVPKPCHENWDAMTPAEQGRFCSQCCKTVTDFTQMSNEEITIYLRKNSENGVCGRFRNDQLEEKVSINIPRKVLYSQTKFINVFLLALLVTMGSMLFSCGNTTKGEVEEATTETAVDTVALPPPPSHMHTTGVVIHDTNDSVTPPPPIEEKEAPKSRIDEVRIKLKK